MAKELMNLMVRLKNYYRMPCSGFVDNNHEIIAHTAGKMKVSNKGLAGDRVTVEMTL